MRFGFLRASGADCPGEPVLSDDAGASSCRAGVNFTPSLPPPSLATPPRQVIAPAMTESAGFFPLPPGGRMK